MCGSVFRRRKGYNWPGAAPSAVQSPARLPGAAAWASVVRLHVSCNPWRTGRLCCRCGHATVACAVHVAR